MFACFYVFLKKKKKKLDVGLYEQAVAEKWVFLVPVNAEPSDMSNAFLRRHVLRPKGPSLYETFEEKPLSVRVEEGRVSTVDHADVPIEVEIVYSETYYDSEYRALRIVNVAGFLSAEAKKNSVPPPASASAAAAGGGDEEVWARLGSSPRSDAAALTLIDSSASQQLAKRLEKFEDIMSSTFSTAALVRHGPLLQQSIGFFCKHAWELGNDTVSELWAAASGFCTARGVTKVILGWAVEGVVMDRLYSSVMPLLCVMHADHDATLALAASYRGEGDSFGVPAEMRGCLEEARAALDTLAQHTTPLGKLRSVQACVGVIARQARLVKSPAGAGTLPETGPRRSTSADPERPLSLTADELLPMLIAVILRSTVPNLSAHLSFIQFRQDKGSELSYYLTTIRAALEFIRNNVSPRLLQQDELSPAEGTPGAGSGISSGLSSFAFEVPPTPESTPALRLSPHQLVQAMKRGTAEAPPLEVKDRWFRLNRYRGCWVASEFCDWIVQVPEKKRSVFSFVFLSSLLYRRCTSCRGRRQPCWDGQ